MKRLLQTLFLFLATVALAACVVTVPRVMLSGYRIIGDGGPEPITYVIDQVTPLDELDAGVAFDANPQDATPAPDAQPADLGFAPDAAAPDATPAPDAAVPDVGLPPDAGAPPTVACAPPTTTRTIHYCPSGSDGSQGSATQPKASLNAFSQDISWGPTESISFLFCRGGVWNEGVRIFPVQGDGHRHYIGAYGDPGLPNPVWRGALDISNGADSDPALGGLVIEDLTLQGSGQTAGIFLFRSVNDVHFCRMDVSGFGNGAQFAQLGDNFSIFNSRFYGNSSNGFLGGGGVMEIRNNVFERNGFNTGSSLQGHNVYISGADDLLVEGNIIRGASDQAGRGCKSVPLVAHGGGQRNLRIRNNLIEEPEGTAAPNCWGIGLDAASGGALGCEDCEIVGNTIRNVGNAAIAVQNVDGLRIEGNIIEHGPGMPFGTTGVSAPSRAPAPGALPLQRVTIFGNKMALASGSTCFYVDPSVLQTSDANECSAAAWSSWGSGFTLNEWQVQTGFDQAATFTQQ